MQPDSYILSRVAQLAENASLVYGVMQRAVECGKLCVSAHLEVMGSTLQPRH